MLPANPTHAIGYYCGRFGSGLFGEPLNSFSNLAFVLGAVVAWHAWRAKPDRDPWQLLLFILAALIGVGSFVFHSYPTPETLLVDIVPIKVFGLSALAYICLRYMGLQVIVTVALAISFFALSQGWIAVAPRGALGGGIEHIPSLLALMATGITLMRRRVPLGGYLLAACAAYVAAIFVRSWDLYLCPTFPYGVHWIWHILTGLTASLIIFGIASVPPRRVFENSA